jgi:hypothetical protein
MFRFMRRFLRVALAVCALITVMPAAPAHADTLYLDIWYIRCNDQSEPISDEISLRVNGQQRGFWPIVDGGDVHWYWSSYSIESSLDIPFTGDSVFIDIMEDDNNDLALIGWLEVPASMVNTGEHEWPASMLDGAYSIRFSVSTTP